MKVLLDPEGMTRLLYGWEASDYSRFFEADAPARVIVVFPSGLDASLLTGAVVEAVSSGEIGSVGRVRPGNKGQEYSQLVIYERVDGPPDVTLSQLLRAGLRD